MVAQRKYPEELRGSCTAGAAVGRDLICDRLLNAAGWLNLLVAVGELGAGAGR